MEYTYIMATLFSFCYLIPTIDRLHWLPNSICTAEKESLRAIHYQCFYMLLVLSMLLIRFLKNPSLWSLVWYADNAFACGKILHLRQWFDLLLEAGPGFGYFPNTEELYCWSSILVCCWALLRLPGYCGNFWSQILEWCFRKGLLWSCQGWSVGFCYPSSISHGWVTTPGCLCCTY